MITCCPFNTIEYIETTRQCLTILEPAILAASNLESGPAAVKSSSLPHHTPQSTNVTTSSTNPRVSFTSPGPSVLQSAHIHSHRQPRSRPRSVSRSSSSPSPPPLSTPRGHVANTGTHTAKERRRLSSSASRTRSPAALGGAGSVLISNGASGPSPAPGRSVRAPRQGEAGPSSWQRFSGFSSFVSADRGLKVDSTSTEDDTEGVSTQYGASASSPGAASEADVEEDKFVWPQGEETEIEDARRRVRNVKSDGPKQARPSVDASSVADGSATPPSSSRVSRASFSTTRRAAPPIPSETALLPRQLRLGPLAISLSRRRAEELLLLWGAIYGIWKLRSEWREHAVAGEIGLLSGLAVLYRTLRVQPTPSDTAASHTPVNNIGSTSSTRSPSPLPDPLNPSLVSHVRDRSGKVASSHFLNPKEELRHRTPFPHTSYPHTPPNEEEAGGTLGNRGCVWGTEDREYRECLDDGVLFALLLGPLVAAAMLHCAIRQLSERPPPESPTGANWYIDPPIILDSTPIRYMGPSSAVTVITDTIRALSALATARRNLVQLFTLCSFVLLIHLVRSLVLEVGQAKTNAAPSSAVMVTSSSMERDSSDSTRSYGTTHTYWLRRGEWKRNFSAVGFSTLVTGGCIIVKVVTAYIGHGVWSDMSPSDVIIATLFYQFSLYVCVRLARRGFTLGELGLVCHAATALFMETVNMTRMKIAILRTPYIKTYRLPTPLLTFQLALIPGSLLTGFLLSPLLYLSRHLAQRPAHRLRFPHEKPVHRRLLALGFYAGAALVCGGIVGTWTKWCLGWRDPFLWVVFWLMEGKRPWTRPALISYWGLLAAVSVAGWSRQLSRARRHRRYVVPGVRDGHREAPGNTTHDRPAPNTLDQKTSGGHRGYTTPSSAEQTSLSGVASQMMDAADQRLPTLSVNARRKFFHALAVVMFVPGIALDPAFTHLAFSVAFAAFTFAEYVRYFALWPFGVSVHLFLNEFLDSKDSGTAILSHFYLLAGCASPLWLEGRCEILSLFGVLSLGVGDAIASIVGRRFGRVKWSTSSGKTVEGSVAFFLSVIASAYLLRFVCLCEPFNTAPFAVCTALVTLLEAVSAQNDNLVLPMYGWAIGTLLGV